MLDNMEEAPIQILEVRPAVDGTGGSITLALSAEASAAIHTALAEQLDRRRAQRLEGAEAVLELREASELVERFKPLAAADAHAIVKFSSDELRSCLLGLTGYVDRMDVDGFQPPELRNRLRLIGDITPVLWDANAAVAAQPLTAHSE